MTARQPQLQAGDELAGIRRPHSFPRRVVWKFGGTSVGDVQRLRAVAARLVTARRQGLQVVAVLSAMGHTTDELVGLAGEFSALPPAREMDALLSVGETISCALAAIAVADLGEPVVSMTGAQAGIITDAAHGRAQLSRVDPGRIIDALDAGKIVLVAGFQGQSENGDVTTLGRGGSDASAIVLAAALGLTECDILTDVDGVYTADPRIVPNARRITGLGHAEMLQLADSGAQVLQTRAVELARAHGVDIHVRSSLVTGPGTWIRKESAMFDKQGIAGIAHRRHDPVYSVTGGSLSQVSAALYGYDIAAGSFVADAWGGVRFTAPGTAAAIVITALERAHMPATVQDLGSVSLVGAAVAERAHTINEVLATLDGLDVPVHLVTTAASRISCYVPDQQVETAARALHDAFDLPATAAEDCGNVA